MKKMYEQQKEIINYLVFGFLTTAISLAVYYLLTSTILNIKSSIELQIANILSWIVGVLFAYFTNRKFVFNSKKENPKKEFLAFLFSRVATLLLDMIIMFLLVTVLKLDDKIIKIVSQILVIVSNYVFSKWIVFGGR